MHSCAIYISVCMCQLWFSGFSIPTLIGVRFKHVLDKWTAKNKRKSKTVHNHLFVKWCFFAQSSHLHKQPLVSSFPPTFAMKRRIFGILFFSCSLSHLLSTHTKFIGFVHLGIHNPSKCYHPRRLDWKVNLLASALFLFISKTVLNRNWEYGLVQWHLLNSRTGIDVVVAELAR